MTDIAKTAESYIEHLISTKNYDTGLETCVFKYEWTINTSGFRNKSSINETTITSPKFSSHYSDFKDEWVMKLHIFDKTYDSDDEEYYDEGYHIHPKSDKCDKGISLSLQLLSIYYNGFSPDTISCKINFNNEEKSFEKINISKILDKIMYIPSNTMISELFAPLEGHLKNNELKITCTISMCKEITYSGLVFTQLSADWKKLLKNEESTDVTICVGKKSFRVIKGILCARSPVFAAMFDEKNFVESKINKVFIEDIDEKVFEKFLHYIYAGDLTDIDEISIELLYVAEKYQLHCLKYICAKTICSMINGDTIAEIFVLSDRYNLQILRIKCLEFMKKNFQTLILNKNFQDQKKIFPKLFLGAFEDLLLSNN